MEVNTCLQPAFSSLPTLGNPWPVEQTQHGDVMVPQGAVSQAHVVAPSPASAGAGPTAPKAVQGELGSSEAIRQEGRVTLPW